MGIDALLRNFVRWIMHGMVLAGLLGVTVAPAAADDLLGGDDAIPEVLTPARLRQPQSEVPASITVIDRELIDASGARDIYDVLKLVPGMNAEVTDSNVPAVNYHAGFASANRRMLVLIDGRAVYQPALARVDWNDLPITLADVERIEVTRGPAAAAYGPNAFQGVINIITRNPEDQQGTYVSTRQGNHGVNDWQLIHGRADNDQSMRLSLSSRRDGGYDKWLPGQPQPNNGLRVDTANFTADWHLSDNDRLALRTGGSSTHLDLTQDNGVAALTAPTAEPWMDDQHFFAQMEWQHSFSDRHQWQGQVYFQHSSSVTNYPFCTKSLAPGLPVESGNLLFSKEMQDLFLATGSNTDNTTAVLAALTDPVLYASLTPAQQSALNAMYGRMGAMAGAGAMCGDLALDIREQRLAAEMQDTLNFERVRLVTGMAVRNDQGYSQTYLSGSRDNQTASLFSDIELKLLDSWLINAGGYFEHDQQNGNYFTPRVANIFKLSPGQSIRFVYSEAVRTMDMYENDADIHLQLRGINAPYSQNTQALLGQPEALFFATQQATQALEAERIRSHSVGYYGHVGDWDMDVSWFREELTDLNSHPINLFSFTPSNGGVIHNYGWEAQVMWRATEKQFWRATFAHINSHSNASEEERFVADNSGSLLWHYAFAPSWSLSAAWYSAHDWHDYPFDRYDTTLARSFALSHARLKLAATLRVRNNEPVVYDTSQYVNDRAFWFSALLSF